MNKSYILLSILVFTSLYIPVTMGMEHKHEKQITKIYTERCKNDKLATEKYLLSTTTPPLPIDLIYLIKPYLSQKDQYNLDLTCKDYFIVEHGWSLMPDNIEKRYDLLFNPHKKHSFNKNAKSNLILAYFAEQNDGKAIHWIINKIKPQCKCFSKETDPIKFAHKNNNEEMLELFIKLDMKNIGCSEQYILDNWESYLNNYPYGDENWKGPYFLPQNQNNSYFLSYCLAVDFDDIDRLKELYLQTKPTFQGIHYLLCQSGDNGPNCFIYLFDLYKNEQMIDAWNDYPFYDECCEIVKNYLKKQQSYCTIQ